MEKINDKINNIISNIIMYYLPEIITKTLLYVYCNTTNYYLDHYEYYVKRCQRRRFQLKMKKIE